MILTKKNSTLPTLAVIYAIELLVSKRPPNRNTELPCPKPRFIRARYAVFRRVLLRLEAISGLACRACPLSVCRNRRFVRVRTGSRRHFWWITPCRYIARSVVSEKRLDLSTRGMARHALGNTVSGWEYSCAVRAITDASLFDNVFQLQISVRSGRESIFFQSLEAGSKIGPVVCKRCVQHRVHPRRQFVVKAIEPRSRSPTTNDVRELMGPLRHRVRKACGACRRRDQALSMLSSRHPGPVPFRSGRSCSVWTGSQSLHFELVDHPDGVAQPRTEAAQDLDWTGHRRGSHAQVYSAVECGA